MSVFEIVVVASVNSVAIVVFAILRGLSVQLSRIERTQGQFALMLREGAVPVDDGDHEIHPSLLSGNRAPAMLGDGDKADPRWRVVIGVLPGCDSCDQVLARLPLQMARLSRYQIEVMSPVPLGALARAVHERVVTDAELLTGAPFALLIDPEGTIQGNASVRDASDIWDFVSEGQLHGFGPGLEMGV